MRRHGDSVSPAVPVPLSPCPPVSLSVPRGATVQRAWLHGLGAVAARRICLHLLGFGAGIILARALSPAEFGIYYVANFYVQVLGTLQTTNMAGALIQSPEAPSAEAEATLFTLEQGLALAAMLLVALAGAAIFTLPGFGGARSIYPFVLALCGVWFINGFALVPNVRLTRRVQYGKTAFGEAIGDFGFYGTAVALALSGAGAWSYILAALAQATLKATMLSWLSPWRVRLAFSKGAARSYLLSGICLQGSVILFMMRENLSPSLGVLFFGKQGVGFYGWAATLAGTTLIPSFIFMQLAFATYARLQAIPHAVSRLIGITFRVTLILSGLVMVALLGFGDDLVRHIYGEKWRPAVPVLYLCTAAAPFALFVGPHLAALMGTGRERVALRINLFWTSGLALLSAFLIARWSYTGLAMAYLICYVVVATLFLVRSDRILRRTVFSTVARFLPAFGAALAVVVTTRDFVTNVPSLGAVAAAALLIYAGVCGLLFRRSLRSDFAWLKSGG